MQRRSPNNNKDRLGKTEKEAFSFERNQVQELAKTAIRISEIRSKALILNGLGFTQRTLYMVSTFFEDKPIEVLLGNGIEPSQLNDTTLGRCLDAIHSYGYTTFYTSNSQFGKFD